MKHLKYCKSNFVRDLKPTELIHQWPATNSRMKLLAC
jgi:hypothetical protein